MKFFLALAFFAVSTCLVLGMTKEEMKADFEAKFTECQADPKSHIDDETLEKFKKHEKVDKEKMVGHMRCMATKMKFVNEDCSVNPDGLKAGLGKVISDEAKLDEIVKECSRQGEDCDHTIKHTIKCLKKYRDHHD